MNNAPEPDDSLQKLLSLRRRNMDAQDKLTNSDARRLNELELLARRKQAGKLSAMQSKNTSSTRSFWFDHR